MCDVIKISLKKEMDNRRIFMTSQMTLFPGPLPWLNSENRRDGSSLGLQVSQQSRPSIQHTQTNTHSLCQRQLIVPNKKWRHTLKMTNNYRPVYILPSVNINDNWPIINLYCMTSLFIRHYKLLPFVRALGGKVHVRPGDMVEWTVPPDTSSSTICCLGRHTRAK